MHFEYACTVYALSGWHLSVIAPLLSRLRHVLQIKEPPPFSTVHESYILSSFYQISKKTLKKFPP